MQLLNTLYVTTPDSYLRLDNDTISVNVEREAKLRVPIHHIGSVVCFGNIGISTPLMHRLAEDGVVLVLLDANGRFKARIEGSTSGNVLLRRAQHQRALDAVITLEIARSCVAGKIKNSRQVLLRGARESKDANESALLSRTADNLAASLRSLPDVGDIDVLRGIEGEAARNYFAALNLLVRSDARSAFQLDGRSRRPPRDRFNALLSFLYSMLTNDCRSACEVAGLDPQVGFLHAVRPGRAALALDLIEEFRHVADRIALTLINRVQVQADDFTEREGGAVMLEGDARKAVVIAYQERKQEELMHPLLSQSVPMGVLPLIQARLLARVIRGESEIYLPFVAR
jgi:CRISPR-associated protein Cas1